MAFKGPIPNIINQDENTIQLQGMDSPITNEAYQNAYGVAPPPVPGQQTWQERESNGVQNGKIIPAAPQSTKPTPEQLMDKSAAVDAQYDKDHPSSALMQGNTQSQNQPTQAAPSSALTQGNSASINSGGSSSFKTPSQIEREGDATEKVIEDATKANSDIEYQNNLKKAADAGILLSRDQAEDVKSADARDEYRREQENRILHIQAEEQKRQIARTNLANAPAYARQQMTTGQNILHFFARALGASSEKGGLLGKGLSALDHYDETVNEEVARQKAIFDNHTDEIDTSKNLFTQYKDLGATDKESELLAAAAIKKEHEDAVAKYDAQMQADPNYNSNAAKITIAKLQETRQKTLADLYATGMKGAEEQANINKLNQKGGVNLEQYSKAAEIPAIKAKTEARRDLDDFIAAKNSGDKQLAIANYIGNMVKRGRLSPQLENELRSKGVIDNIGRVVNEKLSGVDEATLRAMEADLTETNNRAGFRAKRAEQLLRGQGMDPSVIYGNDTPSETAPGLGLKPIQ